jgi:hypothetical protein
MTPEEFATRIEGALEELALFYAHLPADRVEQSFDRMLDRIAAGWRETFKEFGTPEEVAELVAGGVVDVRKRVIARRREIEAGRYGHG